MGETVVVLNGIEFRTRHNDFPLVMPSTSNPQLHATQNIDFPNVPKAVLEKNGVKEQVLEMKEWFRAFKEQNHQVRDYRDYFKPVLCYLEGAWTRAEDHIQEPFISDRHYIDAKLWDDLEERLRFLSYSGGKHTEENFAYLPRIVFNVTEEGKPLFAQWNYRILCHPIQRDLPLKCLDLVDDLKSRLQYGQTLDQYGMSRNARFRLNSKDPDCVSDSKYGSKDLLEMLMREIPGKDNYMGNLRDYGYAGIALDPIAKTPLNTAFYHRMYSVGRRDASGHVNRVRGFSDRNLFMAMTSQKRVLEMNFKNCKKPWSCYKGTQKWTYAIPLEIIYMTPLSKWNPFKLEYRGSANTLLGKKVSKGGRKGTKLRPYDGTNSKLFFQTPSRFFSGENINPGPADTTPNKVVYVLDPKGKPRKMAASGHRIFLPHIKGLGVLRQRYPIAPVHGEGSAVWKELEALKELVMNTKQHCSLFEDTPHSCKKRKNT